MYSLRGNRNSREGAGPLPALLLDQGPATRQHSKSGRSLCRSPSALLHEAPASIRSLRLLICVLPANHGIFRVGLPGLEPGTSSLSETIAPVVVVYRCSKMPANPYFFLIWSFCMFTAVHVRCRQTVVSPQTFAALVKRSSSFTALHHKAVLQSLCTKNSFGVGPGGVEHAHYTDSEEE
jgi:hypothetical protein